MRFVRIIAFALVVSSFMSGLGGMSVYADSIEIHPTIFKEVTLKQGERKKSYVDVVNPTATKQTVVMKAQGFRQTDDSGSLDFYNDDRIAQGVKLDLNNFELSPREAIRVYFLLDGSILPSGEVFAAIFAQTSPTVQAAAQSVQVGSLLAIINGTPSSHVGDISQLSASPLQIGGSIDAHYAVKNPANDKMATGFFPEITVRAWPYDTRNVEGPLLFAGRTRSIQYHQPGNYFGIINLQVSAGGQQASRLLFAVTGYWRWLAPLILVVAIVGAWAVKKASRWSWNRQKR